MKLFGKKNTLQKNVEIGLINDSTPFAIREAYKTLYTNIIYVGIEDKCKKIVLTSAVPSEGKSSVSANLAYTIGQNSSSARVLLVDADMRVSKIHTFFDIDANTHGLSEFLAGVDDAPNFVYLKDKNVSVLTSGARSLNPTQLLSSSNMVKLFEIFEEKFDFIIIDTPPVNVVTDALLFNEYVNGYVISTLSDHSDVYNVDECVEQLNRVGAIILGFVLSALKLKNYGGKYRYARYNNRYSDEDKKIRG